MAPRAAAAGARFAERDRWQVPVVFGGESEHAERVGFADLSHLGKLEVRGMEAPSLDADVLLHRVAPDRWIVLCRFAESARRLERLAPIASLVLDQCGAWCVIGIVGPQRSTLIRRLTPLPAFPASGPVGEVSGHVLERTNIHLVLVPHEYGQYAWDVVADLAEPLGGGPIGVDLVARITREPVLEG